MYTSINCRWYTDTLLMISKEFRELPRFSSTTLQEHNTQCWCSNNCEFLKLSITRTSTHTHYFIPILRVAHAHSKRIFCPRWGARILNQLILLMNQLWTFIDLVGCPLKSHLVYLRGDPASRYTVFVVPRVAQILDRRLSFEICPNSQTATIYLCNGLISTPNWWTDQIQQWLNTNPSFTL